MVFFVAVVFVVALSAAGVSEPQAFVYIFLAVDISVPVSVVVGEVDSSEHPKFFVSPNTYYYSRYSSSVEAAG